MNGARRLALWAALAWATSPQAQPDGPVPDDRLAMARRGFESPRNDERQAAARALLRDLAPADVDAALAAVEAWPPTAALLLRQTLAGSGRVRATLLERATRTPAPPATHDPGGVARTLVVEGFVARAAATAPFRPEPEQAGDAGWPLVERGVWLAQPADVRVGWSWYELDDALEREGLLARALVPTSACADHLVAAPIARRFPAEGWFGVAAERASLRCVPLAVGAWLVTKERAEQLGSGKEGRGDRATARALERETRLLEEELAALARLPDLRRGAIAADLLRRLGLDLGDGPIGNGTARELAFAAGVALARAARGEGPVPVVDAADGADPVVAAFVRNATARSVRPAAVVDRVDRPVAAPPAEEAARLLWEGRGAERRDPAGLCERPAAEVRAVVARLLDLGRGRTGAAVALRGALAAVVDAIAGRFADDPLLGGQLVELLRHEVNAPSVPDDVKAVLEAGARELWALDRGTRPPSRLVLLPSGAAR